MFFFLFACNGISAQEAQDLFQALYQPVFDISETCISESSFNEELDITLTGGSTWEGTMQVIGIREDYEDTQHYTLDFIITETYIATGNLTVEGTIPLYIEYAIDPTDNLSYTQSASLGDQLVVSGDVSGLAKLNYTLTEQYNAREDTFTTQASGDINNHDVSGFLSGSTQ